jgi:hypothetical protein
VPDFPAFAHGVISVIQTNPDQRKAADAFRACMRAHGIANFPDPRVTAHGYAGAAQGVDKPVTAPFQAAKDACTSVDAALVQAQPGESEG